MPKGIGISENAKNRPVFVKQLGSGGLDDRAVEWTETSDDHRLVGFSVRLSAERRLLPPLQGFLCTAESSPERIYNARLARRRRRYDVKSFESP